MTAGFQGQAVKAFRASDFPVTNDRRNQATLAPSRHDIAYHQDVAAAQADAHIADCLAAPATAPFDRAAWWHGLCRDCGMVPFFARATDPATGATVLLPLARDGRRLVALANWYSFRWRPMMTTGADIAPAMQALAADLPRQTGRITLSGVPDEAGEATHCAQAFRAAGWVVAMTRCDINHVLQVRRRSFALYLAGRPGPLRTTLARKGARVACEIHTEFTEALWDEYEAVYNASWKPAEGSPAFLRHFARAEGNAGRLRLGFARIDGAAVATQFWTVEAGTAFIHKLAHIESAHKLSPGTTLTAAMLERAIDTDRVSEVDFGTGDEAYKRDWMEAARPRYRLDMFHPVYPRYWPHILRHVARVLTWKRSRLAERRSRV